MNHNRLNRSLLAMAIAALAACGANAGNIPQYAFSKTPGEFKFLDGGTKVPVNNDGSEIIFADGSSSFGAKSGKGFEIGFDFRFGGKVFNQVAINSDGKLLFGKDQVVYRGNVNKFFGDNILSSENYHYLGFYAAKGAAKAERISYKTEGEPGKRTFTVEFKNVQILNSSNANQGGSYSSQIVLCEEDNSVHFNFIEVETPYESGYGMAAGIAGWEHSDRYAIYAPDMTSEFSRSTVQDINSIVEPLSYIHWPETDVYDPESTQDEDFGADGKTHCKPFEFSLNFVPEPAMELTDQVPGNLRVDQKGDKLVINCDRAEGAGATLIMVSEKPLTAAEMPVEGISYQVKDQEGNFVSKLGDATVLYYSQDEHPTVTFDGVESSTPYYIRAVAANGYPSYGIKTADLEFVTSHPAPLAVSATPGDENHVTLNVNNDMPVLIASSTARAKTYSEGPTGYFGEPTADMVAGEPLDENSKVVYVGEPGEISIEVEKNIQHFFRVWTLKDGKLSALYTETRGVSAPSLPYEPQIESWTLYETPTGWTNVNTNKDATVDATFQPTYRNDDNINDKNEYAVKGISVNGTEATLITPVLPLSHATTLSFEWAMETVRDVTPTDPISGPSVQLPEGNDPGVFGMGHKFVVAAGNRGTENALWETDTYGGKMISNPSEPDKNISGTSEFLPVTIDLSDKGLTDKNRISFKFSTKGYSLMYLRKIRIDGKSSGVEEITLAPATADGIYPVYNMQGIKVGMATVADGVVDLGQLPAGLYICNGLKIRK